MNFSGRVQTINAADKMSRNNKPDKEYTVFMDDGRSFSAGIEAPPFIAGQEINIETEFKFGKEQMLKPGQAPTPQAPQPAQQAPRAAPQGQSRYTPKPFPLPAEQYPRKLAP